MEETISENRRSEESDWLNSPHPVKEVNKEQDQINENEDVRYKEESRDQQNHQGLKDSEDYSEFESDMKSSYISIKVKGGLELAKREMLFQLNFDLDDIKYLNANQRKQI